MKDKSKLLPFRLVDSAERDLRMAAAQTRFDAARRLLGYEDGQSMSPPRLELRDGPDGGKHVVVEWSAPEAVMLRWRQLRRPIGGGEGGGGETGGGGGGGGGEAVGDVLAMAVGDADGGEGGVLALGEAEGGEGGELVAATAAEQPWAPKNTEELLHAMATTDYAVSTDRSWSKAYPKAIQTYNAAAGMYNQVVQQRGQPLREGFTIVKVRATPHVQSRTPRTISCTSGAISTY